MTCIVVVSNCCNKLKSLYLTKYPYLKSIEIGDDCFSNVDIFKIDGLNELKSLKIGDNSFTKNKNSYGSDSSRSFSILNCDELESIEIGRFSFSDYGGGFKLNNLPKLSTIKIGSIETDYSESNNKGWSVNFWYSSFEMKSMVYDIANE